MLVLIDSHNRNVHPSLFSYCLAGFYQLFQRHISQPLFSAGATQLNNPHIAWWKPQKEKSVSAVMFQDVLGSFIWFPLLHGCIMRLYLARQYFYPHISIHFFHTFSSFVLSNLCLVPSYVLSRSILYPQLCSICKPMSACCTQKISVLSSIHSCHHNSIVML